MLMLNLYFEYDEKLPSFAKPKQELYTYIDEVVELCQANRDSLQHSLAHVETGPD